MKTVKITNQKLESITEDQPYSLEIVVKIDDLLFEVCDEPYESTDAWAVYTVLKKLASKGFIELECAAEIEEYYKKQPNPFCGPAGPQGMTGVCKCDARVEILEEKMGLIENQIKT